MQNADQKSKQVTVNCSFPGIASIQTGPSFLKWMYDLLPIAINTIFLDFTWGLSILPTHSVGILVYAHKFCSLLTELQFRLSVSHHLVELNCLHFYVMSHKKLTLCWKIFLTHSVWKSQHRHKKVYLNHLWVTSKINCQASKKAGPALHCL